MVHANESAPSARKYLGAPNVFYLWKKGKDSAFFCKKKKHCKMQRRIAVKYSVFSCGERCKTRFLFVLMGKKLFAVRFPALLHARRQAWLAQARSELESLGASGERVCNKSPGVFSHPQNRLAGADSVKMSYLDIWPATCKV